MRLEIVKCGIGSSVECGGRVNFSKARMPDLMRDNRNRWKLSWALLGCSLVLI